MRTLLILSLLSTLAFAQQDGVTGTVSGHVYCADIQRPARLARVVLVPLPPAITTPPVPISNNRQQYSGETRSDGSFLVTHVPPGDYYVSVNYPGYLTPEYQFSPYDLLQPTDDVRKRIVETIPTLTVAANRTAAISVSVHRGAAISGTLRYDDGSPIPDVEVVPLYRDASGSWAQLAWTSSNNVPGNGGTDDLGHFRIRGLAPGEYTLRILRKPEYQAPLAVYYGDAFFAKDAKSIKLTDGQESSGADVTVRLSKLHSISGSLIDTSGQPINSNQVFEASLYTIPDNIEIASAVVVEGDAAFHMDLVPEGTYTLRVTEAHYVNRAIVRYPKDPTQQETYGDYQAPLEVTSDITGLNLTILAKPKQAAAAPCGSHHPAP